MLRVEIDRDRCTGHGRCYAVAPAVFAPDDEGYGVLIALPAADDDVVAGSVVVDGAPLDGPVVDGLVADEHAEPVRLATINCPEYAISVADAAD